MKNQLQARVQRFAWGPPAILGTNVLLYIVLTLLSHSAADPFDRTVVLAIGNLLSRLSHTD